MKALDENATAEQIRARLIANARTDYTGVRMLSAGLAGMCFRGERQLWTLGRLVKEARCCMCFEDIAKGSPVWRPIGNKMNRAQRMHEKCLPQPERAA